jgi:hypothetical protein
MVAILCIQNKTGCISHLLLQIFIECICKAAYILQLSVTHPEQWSSEFPVSQCPAACGPHSNGCHPRQHRSRWHTWAISLGLHVASENNYVTSYKILKFCNTEFTAFRTQHTASCMTMAPWDFLHMVLPRNALASTRRLWLPIQLNKCLAFLASLDVALGKPIPCILKWHINCCEETVADKSERDLLKKNKRQNKAHAESCPWGWARKRICYQM